MKSVKTMLLGIAVLIIASCGVSLWMAGSGIGAIIFYTGLAVGLILCFVGFMHKENK